MSYLPLEPAAMRAGERPTLPVLFLGETHDEGLLSLFAQWEKRGQPYQVVTSLAELTPAAVKNALLLTELFWLEQLTDEERQQLTQLTLQAGSWLVLTPADAPLAQQLGWLRRGVEQFLPLPADPERLQFHLDSLVDRLLGPPLRVVVVDDSPTSLHWHSKVLANAGFAVTPLSDPLETLTKLQEVRPDVLVLDIEMPTIRGPELVTLLRQHAEWTRLPVIYLTGHDTANTRILARYSAAEDFLTKPVASELLVAAVDAHARRYRGWQREQAYAKALQRRERARTDQILHAVDAHAIVSITDAQGTITFVNDKFCDISGYSREELLGQNHRIVKSGVHPPEFYAGMWQTISSGQIWQGEVCNRHKSGRRYWVAATLFPVLNEEGKPTAYISIRTDITRIKEQEEALRVRDERLRRSQIYANIGTWDWNIVTGELYWSEQIPVLFGYPPGELETSYENFLNAVHPDDRQAVIDAVNASVEYDAPYEIEHRVVWPNGEVRWLLERGAVIRDAEGRALHMLGVVQDIDERKRTQLALLESKRRLAFAIEGPGDGVWDWDIPTGTLRYSGRYEEMLGYAKGEIPETIEAWKESVYPDDFPYVHNVLDEYLRGVRDRYEVELRLRCRDGTYKWILCRGTVVERDNAGKPRRMIGIHSDITARKAMEAELIAAREAAEAANRAKSEFLSSMSHELRTPLNAILGFAQLLEVDETLTREQRDNVYEIRKAGQHLLELINEVLDLAKIEAGRIDLSLEPTQLLAVVEECFQLMAPLAAQKGVTVRHFLTASPLLFADRNRLRQVLLNLLSNAIKYNLPSGQVTLRAERVADRTWRIAVQDTGPGIPPEKMSLLFQPFNRLGKEASNIEGTGIGLTITKKLVELMGGQVGVESTVGIGSTFWIELPAAPPNPEAGDETPCEGEATPLPCPKTTTMLAVDDNPTNLKVLAQMVSRLCPTLHLVTAHTPRLGLDLAQTLKPALIFLDIGMPGMDGFELLRILKADERLRATPVVALSAHAMPRDIEKGLAAGFDDYLTKPLDLTTLKKTLERFLTVEELLNGRK